MKLIKPFLGKKKKLDNAFGKKEDNSKEKNTGRKTNENKDSDNSFVEMIDVKKSNEKKDPSIIVIIKALHFLLFFNIFHYLIIKLA